MMLSDLKKLRLPRLLLLEQRVAELVDETKRLQNQLDLFKSSCQVDVSLIDEFQRWKKENPPPDNPLVSVCVATYNRAELLVERCLQSILQQTYKNIEIIVVGDACTDDTFKRLESIKDSRLRYVNLKERGEYPSDPVLRWMVAGTVPINYAMSLANGYYVTHLDDDDAYNIDRIEKLVTFSLQHDLDFVWHPFMVQSNEDKWNLNPSPNFAHGWVSTSSVFYKRWFVRIEWDINAYRLYEPGDWNRFRRIGYMMPTMQRYDEVLLWHYREQNQSKT